MDQNTTIEPTDEELLKKAKTLKSTKIYDAVIIGFLAGIAIYSTVRNGFGLLSFLPLIYLPIAAKNKTKNKDLENLLNERGLK